MLKKLAILIPLLSGCSVAEQPVTRAQIPPSFEVSFAEAKDFKLTVYDEKLMPKQATNGNDVWLAGINSLTGLANQAIPYVALTRLFSRVTSDVTTVYDGSFNSESSSNASNTTTTNTNATIASNNPITSNATTTTDYANSFNKTDTAVNTNTNTDIHE
ncbi:hypothetical protein [Beggiatoa leptomitoformis]|uniref:Lipoprotein n=1 Tax=Beggiatoa leptomitoformis TaxID=288004 RepID=A0A2N9YH68_9GAMM|nr:hypothetical protein [Beggiatoa leptomitoformis]ALG67889.1 hypothetical protein AL038_09420 [Beggiatoa leptomitoformis]AUI69847.1 hypothetical protein BLE401_14880 [Beggiatoa leptomitoformis]